MKIRDLGISSNWLEQLIGHWLSPSRGKRSMNLQAWLCPELDDVARMQVTFVNFSSLLSWSRFQSKGSSPLLAAIRLTPTLRDSFYLICGNIYQWKIYQLSWRKRIFHSQIEIQGSLPYHSPWWDYTPCMNQSQAPGWEMLPAMYFPWLISHKSSSGLLSRTY